MAKLWRAINLDFRFHLPNKIRQADHRASDSVKYMRHIAAMSYYGLFNEAREDRIRLHALPDLNLVTQIAIVQQITTKAPKGDLHHFKFYGGANFFPEIGLSGKRIQITSHVLDQFEKRFPGNAGAGLTNLITVLFAHPWMTAQINHSTVLMTPYDKTIFAFPFVETNTEFLLKTCLTVNEINSFTQSPPANIYNHHYATQFTPPTVRHWDPAQELEHCRQIWLNHISMQPDDPPLDKNERWFHLGYKFTRPAEQLGFDPGSKFVFMDDIPGPVSRCRSVSNELMRPGFFEWCLREACARPRAVAGDNLNIGPADLLTAHARPELFKKYIGS